MPEEYKKHLSARTIAKLQDWVNHGGDLSGFWGYLLSGDYGNAACNADGDHIAELGYMIRFLEQSVPGDCFGSVEKVKNWQGIYE